jgi:hypothetical protein
LQRWDFLHCLKVLDCVEPPCTDPYARWCGREESARTPPMPLAGFSFDSLLEIFG